MGGFDAVYRNRTGRDSAGLIQRAYEGKQQLTTSRYDGELPTRTQREDTPKTIRGEFSLLVVLFAQLFNLRSRREE